MCRCVFKLKSFSIVLIVVTTQSTLTNCCQWLKPYLWGAVYNLPSNFLGEKRDDNEDRDILAMRQGGNIAQIEKTAQLLCRAQMIANSNLLFKSSCIGKQRKKKECKSQIVVGKIWIAKMSSQSSMCIT